MYADQPAIDARRRAVVAHIEALADRLETPPIGRTAILGAEFNNPARVTRSTTESASGLLPMPLQGRLVPNESHTVERRYLLKRRNDPTLRDIIAQPYLGIRVDFDCPIDGCRGVHGVPTFDFLEITDDEFVVVECKTRRALIELAQKHPGFVVVDQSTGEITNPTIQTIALAYGFRFEYFVSDAPNPVQIRNENYLARAYLAGPVPDVDADPIIEVVRQSRLGIGLGELIAGRVADPLVLQRLIGHDQLYVDREVHFVGDPDHVPVYVSAPIAAADAHRVTPGWAIWRHPAEAHLRRGDRLVWDHVPYVVENAGDPKVTLRLDDGSLRPYDRLEIEGLIRTGAVLIVARELVEDHPGRAVADAVYQRSTPKAWRAAHRRADLVGRYLADPRRRIPSGTSHASLDRWMAQQRLWLHKTGDNFVGFFPRPRPGNPRDGLPPGIREVSVEVIEARYFGVSTRPTQAIILGEIFRVSVERNLWLGPEAQKALTPALHEALDPAARRVMKLGKPPVGPLSEKTLRDLIHSLESHRNLVARLGDRAAYIWKPWADVDPDGIAIDGDWSMAVGHVDWTELDLEGVGNDFSTLGRFWIGRYVEASAGIPLGRFLSFDPPNGAHTLELFHRVAQRYGTICDLTVVDLGSEHRTADVVMFALRYGKEVRYRPKRAGRAGGAVERPWWVLDIELVYGLVGNTQSTKRARTMSTATNPKLHALWRLLDLDDVLDEYDRIAEARPRPIDGMPRREAFEAGFLVHGRPPPDIGSDPLLSFYTSSSVSQKAVQIHPPVGVHCDGLDYFHPLFDVPALKNRPVVRRRLLGDVSRLWVQVSGPIDVAVARLMSDVAMQQSAGAGYGAVLGLPDADDPSATAHVPAVWVEARCRQLVSVRVASRKEVEVLAAEIPALADLRRRGGAAYGYELARNLEGARETERSQAQRKKDEAKSGAASPAPGTTDRPPAVAPVTRGLGASRPTRRERLRQSTQQEGAA